MNVKKELQKIKGIKNVVCRENGELEIYQTKDVKNDVCRFICQRSLQDCFTNILFYNLKAG